MEDPTFDTGHARMSAALAVLQARFLAGLNERWAQIASADSRESRAAALHRLAGAAGSFGFESLGASARRAELATLQDGEDAASQAALHEIACAIDTLSRPTQTCHVPAAVPRSNALLTRIHPKSEEQR